MDPHNRSTFHQRWFLVASRLIVATWVLAGDISNAQERSAQPAPAGSKSKGPLKPDPSKVLQAIAQGIEGLKGEFPQLKEFSPEQAFDAERLTISYSYRTHRSDRRGGWTAGVPNPDEDGIWFYIDLHDPDSQAQIHTQPVTVALCLGQKRAMFLILEGSQTKSVAGRISSLMSEHGITSC
jgi:hypothetical protein